MLLAFSGQEVRDGVKHSTACRTDLTTKNYPALNANSSAGLRQPSLDIQGVLAGALGLNLPVWGLRSNGAWQEMEA